MNINITRESALGTLVTVEHSGITVDVGWEDNLWRVESILPNGNRGQFIGDSVNRIEAEAMAVDWALRVATAE